MDEQTKNLYEIAFYTKEENSAPVKAVVAAHRGEIMGEKPFEKVRFEYKIEKELFAFLGTLRVMLPPEEISPLSRALSLAPGVLRFLITTVAPKKENESEERKLPEKKRTPSPRAVSSEPSILTNEEIEKKIEEILQ